MNVCRICRSSTPGKDVRHLQYRDANGYAGPSKILHFCLDIQFTENEKIPYKLCTKCFKKLLIFYKFKSMALRNYAYFKSEDLRGPQSSATQEKCLFKVVNNADLEISQNNSRTICGTVKEIINEIYYIEEDSIIVPEKYDTEDPLDNESNEYETVVSDSEIAGDNEIEIHNTENMKTKELPLNSDSKQFRENKSGHKSIKCCNTCNKDVADLHGHLIRVHHPELAKYECKLCGARYRVPSLLKAHNCKLAKDLPRHFECNICHRKYLNERLLNIHRASSHQEKDYLCQYCSKKYSRHSYLVKHLRSHTKEKPFRCPTCDKCFSHSGALYRHKLLHQPEKTYHCTQCDKSYYNSCSLATHMESHKQTKDIPCRYCGALFYRYAQRHAHEFKAHKRPFNTNDTVHSQAKGRRDQIAKDGAKADKADARESYLCQLCPMTFVRKSQLNLHLKYHGQQRPHACPQCSRSYLTSAGLQYHRQFAHTDHKLFQCTLCARDFSTPKYLRQHMVSHSEEKAKFQCKYCGVNFTSQIACREHEKKLHEKKTIAFKNHSETFENLETDKLVI